MATTAAEDTWLTHLHTDLPTYEVLILHCENLSALHRIVRPYISC